eukprot:2544583-Amphidinium_carterae.1
MMARATGNTKITCQNHLGKRYRTPWPMALMSLTTISLKATTSYHLSEVLIPVQQRPKASRHSFPQLWFAMAVVRKKNKNQLIERPPQTASPPNGKRTRNLCIVCEAQPKAQAAAPPQQQPQAAPPTKKVWVASLVLRLPLALDLWQTLLQSNQSDGTCSPFTSSGKSTPRLLAMQNATCDTFRNIRSPW